ncbi:hypothetical protein V8G54_029622 [Vigna mungo]|uniref:Transcription factor CBF/NF-Y/archaeal histone domain-containing protein n=1 Tax=Vigna mungo TaxID=3915 RepID=A0AAQ3MUM7_VIGMU
MSDAPASPSHESGGEQSPRASSSGAREQDRFLPIANISRIMKKGLPPNGKIAKDAKDTMQECVSEFISFITSEASEKCQKEKRKTINGDDLLWAMATLGFEDYIEPLKVYLASGSYTIINLLFPFPFCLVGDFGMCTISQTEGDTKGSTRGGDGSARPDQVGLAGQNSQLVHQGSLNYISLQVMFFLSPSLLNA